MNGEIGDRAGVNRLNPVWIMDDVADVTLGSSYTAAVRTDGSLWIWGGGPMGDGTFNPQRSPMWLIDDAVAVAAGSQYTMVIRTDGSLWGWGANSNGQLGTSNPDWHRFPIWVMDDIVAIGTNAAGNTTIATCTAGNLWAWGWNSNGQVGDGTTISRFSPVLINESGTLPAMLITPMEGFTVFADDNLTPPTLYIYATESLVVPDEFSIYEDEICCNSFDSE